MDHFIPIFRLYGLLFYGLFAYMNHFSRDKRGPYIRNWAYQSFSAKRSSETVKSQVNAMKITTKLNDDPDGAVVAVIGRLAGHALDIRLGVVLVHEDEPVPPVDSSLVK